MEFSGLQEMERVEEMIKRKVFMKKCLGVLLALALCLTYVPGAYAEEPGQAEAGQGTGSDSFTDEDASDGVQSPEDVPPAEPDTDPAPDPGPDQEPEEPEEPEEPGEMWPGPFYSDVPESRWSYANIRALFDLGIIPPMATFGPVEGCTRLDFVNMLYKCHLSICGEQEDGEAEPQTEDTEEEEYRFTDVLPGSEGYDAVMWAVENGITSGINDTEFGGSRVLSRQEGAVFVIRMSNACGISLPKAIDMTMFSDAAKISEYARSSVAACQMAKLLSGRGDGKFAPNGNITNEEAATLVYRLHSIASNGPASGQELVSTEPGAYDDEFSQKLFFIKVPGTVWSYQYIKTLYDMGMYEDVSVFEPTTSTTRLEFIEMLYELHLAIGGEEGQHTESSFTDVPAGSSGFQAVMWAVDNEVTSGVGGGKFGSSDPVTREQCAEFLVRMARSDGISLVKKENASLFKDSSRITKYARSSVTACQMADVINGYGGKKFMPRNSISHQESATIVCKFMDAAINEPPEGAELVSTKKDAYLDLYAKVDYVFGTPVPACDPVPASWFDDAVFIGDSVSVGLESYQNSTKALGKATMLCSVSFNAINALLPVSSTSLHPKYNGVKRLLEDNIKACGAKNVYIMLGMNGLTYPVDYTMERMETMINNILKKNPGVNIIIQSVTPMTNNSYLISKYGYSNSRINQFNERLKQLCAKRKWYYVDVGSALKDSNGALRTEFCSDNYDMGIHVTNAACAAWVEYLKTHVPADLQP